MSDRDRLHDSLPDTRVPRILVVDDSEVERLLLGSILEEEGYVVRVAEDGPTARRLAAQEPFDAVLLDVVMPQESGFETCRLLKQQPAMSRVPILFLSTLEDTSSKVQGLTVGAVDYVTKPPNRDEVLARVALHIRLSRSFQMQVQLQAERLEGIRAAQVSLLTDPAAIPDARCQVFYRPLYEAGGDFYEILGLGNDVWAYFVSDVSGHDPGVSLITSALKALLHQGARLLYTPQEMLAAMNEALLRLLKEEQYVVASLAVVNRRRRRLSIAGAALPPALLVGVDGKARVVEAPGDVLGMFPTATYGHTVVTLEPGERLYICTDGCFDGAPSPGRTRWDQYVAACVASRSAQLSEAPALVVGDLYPPGSRRNDDQLLLAADT